MRTSWIIDGVLTSRKTYSESHNQYKLCDTHIQRNIDLHNNKYAIKKAQ